MKINKNKNKSSVQANTLGETAKAVRSFFDTVLKQIDKLITDKGWLKEKGKSKEIEAKFGGKVWKGYRKYYESANGYMVAVSIYTDPDDEQMCNLIIEVKNEPKMKLEKLGIAKSKLASEIDNYFQDHYETLGSNDGEAEGEDADVNSSKRIKVTLKRVTAGTEDTIHLVAINANHSIVEAMDTVDEVLEDEDFTDMIGEDEVSFEITEAEGEDGYNVEEIDNDAVDASAAYDEMFKAAVRLYHNIQAVHWGAKGLRMWELHNSTDNLMWTYRSRIDVLAELIVEKTGRVPHVAMYCCPQSADEETDITKKLTDGFSFEDGMQYVRAELQNWIQVAEGYYVNLDHDIQGMLDEWLRSDKREADYFMDRQLMVGHEVAVGSH